MSSPRRNLRSYSSRTIRGESTSSDYRVTEYATARRVRQQLHPVNTQQTVATQLNITRQAVEWIELRALSKVIKAFKKEINGYA